MQIDHPQRGYRYFRNAVERHWDPYEIDLEQDLENLKEFDYEGDEEEEYAGMLRTVLALFGAGEESVTEDLSPFGVVFEEIEDQMFITTQLYEEAKHTEFFDRYWREVIHPVEEELGLEQSSPTEDRWYSEEYDELFEREEEALHALLDDPSPEQQVRAHAHYHLTVEGVLAQTGYWGITKNFDGTQGDELPRLPGLVEGIANIRSDEGRHVGFGMAKIKEHLESGRVEPAVLDDVLADLLPLVQATVTDVFGDVDPDEFPGTDPGQVANYAIQKHQDRMEQITNVDAEIPGIDELVALDDDVVAAD